ncbi:citrate synthase [Pseudonocardia sp. GCM10023141]|uniref:citrate synthase n=1 Tax=Pseudonocardia sp. GCM10023141 TaxID=3252653 RepID=UPI003612B21C
MTRDRLTTREVADRLAVKPETIYAYVSRGLLTSSPAENGRGSTFDRAEVEALARDGRRAGAPAGGGVPAVTTAITLIDGDRYWYRGTDPVTLARFPYETVAEWLWTGRWEPDMRFVAPAGVVAEAAAAVGALPAGCGPVDRLRVATIVAAAADPLRFELSAASVCAAGRAIPAVGIGALDGAGDPDASLAARLWAALSSWPAGAAEVAVLNAAMVLLLDHDLAASTFAVRVAASARAHPYAAVSAGLGALEGPLHGGASEQAHRMLLDALERGSVAVVAEHVRSGQRVPGLGHRVYRSADPRAEALFALLTALPQARGAVTLAREIAEIMSRSQALPANVDLALAALSVAFGMPAHAGETIFAVARTAGWIAHALEEYAAAPLRMRPSGHYRGRRPPQPAPAQS